jgi:TP901 family phage tail tape measure protein
MAVPLASAFIRLEPDENLSGFQKSGDKAGQTAGKSYADGFTRDASGRLRQANGRFATDAQKRMIEGGGASGRGFGNAFSKEGGGVISRGFGKLKSELGPLLVPAGIGAAVLAIGKIGTQYEDNLNILKSVTKATGDQMAQVSEKARQLGSDVTLPGVSAAGAAEAMTELAKAGFSVQQAMDAAKGTLQLARVANMSEAEASEIAANAVNAFGLEAKDTTFVVDELASAANTSSLEVKEASDSFKMAAAVFSAFQGKAVGSKESITELNTAIAILGNNGIKGSDAGTSLKQMLLQLTGPSHRAKNSMEAIALAAGGAEGSLKNLYITVGSGKNKVQQDTGLTLMQAALTGTQKQSDLALEELSKLNPALADVGDIAYDASGKMRPLRDIIDLTTRGLKGETEENRNAALTQIFGADATRSIIALMKGGLPVYDKQRAAILQQGSAADFAAAKNAGLKGAIDNVRSQLENAAIGIYNVVKGPLTTGLNDFAKVLAATFSWIGENLGTLRDWAVAIGAVTIALRVNSAMIAIQAGGSLVNYIKSIRLVTATTRLWAAGQALLNVTLLLNPIGLVIIAITAFVAGFILAYRHVGWFRKAVDAAWAGIKVAIKVTVDWITGTVWPSLKRAWDAIAAGALWLWRNALLPAWNGIKIAVSTVIAAVTAVMGGLVAAWRGVAAAAIWLWQTILAPVFGAMRKFFEIWWLVIEVIFVGLYRILQFTVGGAIKIFAALWQAVWTQVKAVFQLWWNGIKVIFGLFVTYIGGPFVAGLRGLQTAFSVVFNAIRTKLQEWYSTYVKPVFQQVQAAWKVLAGALTQVWTGTVKPMLQKFMDFIRKDVPGAFDVGVKAIGKAWDVVKETAKKPVAFVVNQVINPFIGGLNKAAALVGVKDRVEPIKGFADGGRIPGFANGGRIAGMPAATDNRQAMVSGLGPVKLMGGEFVVNAKDTRKALPLLKWINGGMKRGAGRIASMVGRPVTGMPGDGSEGWAFKGGGLVGWASDVWGAITDPVGAIKKPFEQILGQIPGVGMIKDFLIGSAKRLLNGAIAWITGGTGGGKVGAAQQFVRSQEGKPYVWASAGPGGYDCSGIVSAAYNVLKGKNPYAHTFSTGGLPGPWFDTGKKIGALVAGWSHPGQSPAGSVGHMAGQIGGLPFESTGSIGVRVGGSARKVGQFANVGVARAGGGLVEFPVKLYDNGGAWPSGTLGMNMSGRTEYVSTRAGGDDGTTVVEIHIHAGVIGSQTELDGWLEKGIKRLKNQRKLP